MHTKQWPYRTYVIGAKILKGALSYSLWWDTGNIRSKWVTEPYHYVRLQEFDDLYDLLIVGGEDHKVGQADKEDIPETNRYESLWEWTRKKFPAVESIEYKWSGQVMEPIDSLGFIGKNPGDDNIYIITGDSGNGMTHGTIGGILVADIINGKRNLWEELYSPSRITWNTAGDFLREAGNMVAQYADWIAGSDIKELSQLSPGQGGIFTSGIKKIAVYRNENNQIQAFSASCPHLGGLLQWNAEEKSFDCPAHGSRFTGSGKVMNGPSLGDMKKLDIKE
jgi:nitrite reductase/ring-hydroxylating ferredoxin subunit